MSWKNVQYENGKFKTSSGGGGGGSSTLAGLDDVNLSSPSDGQILIYNATSNKWVNGGIGHNYSTTEHVIGTWIDGKPLYEKTFVANFTGATSIELENSGIEYAQQIASSYVSSNVLDTPFFLYQNTYVFCYIDVRDNGRMLLYNNYNGSIQWTVTVQYTKTTDT